jgi:SAM-dependent methyltransferase
MTAKSELNRKPFSDKMTDILNYGALNLAMAIGYRTGLFDVMDTFDAAQTAECIAARAGLDKRYVKEWLSVMATGEIVILSLGADGEDLFYLPKHHGDLLTRRAGNENIGVYTQEIPLLTACAYEAVNKGFATGVGVAYDHYPKFQNFMSELAEAKHRQILVDRFLPSVDDGKLIKLLHSGIDVCDLGCAEGVALMLMAKAYPQSRFIGIDISPEAIDGARREAHRQSIDNIDFFILDAATLKDNEQLKNSFHYVTAFDAIHDQTRPDDVLKGVHHILVSGGRFSMVDIAASSHLSENVSHPLAPFLYTVSLMHCMPVGMVDGGMGLGMMWGRERALEMLEKSGFSQVQIRDMPDDPFNLHFLCRKMG